MDLFSLEGKVAIVTGACGLLGTKHCEALAAAGATVVAADLDEKAATAVALRLGGSGHMGVGVDVTSVDSLRACRDRVLTAYGQIDVLVNNAAINDMFENPALAGQHRRRLPALGPLPGLPGRTLAAGPAPAAAGHRSGLFGGWSDLAILARGA